MSERISTREFVRLSLELNLFFQRIMKEHAFFLEIGFLEKDAELARRANKFMEQFNALLRETDKLAYRNISEIVLLSGEVVTDKTLRAEQKTSELSGVEFDTDLTRRELKLKAGKPNPKLADVVFNLNKMAIALTKELIGFKTMVLNEVLRCKLFTADFPLLIDHIRREAIFYLEQLERLQSRVPIDLKRQILMEKAFWDRIMKEHAIIIAHLLDPTEAALIQTAEGFADLFQELQEKVRRLEEKGIGRPQDLVELIKKEAKATRSIRDFKAEATELLLACKIRSIIIPLLGDHVLREANHFLRILNDPRSLE